MKLHTHAYVRHVLLTILLLACVTISAAQATTTLRGVVLDSLTQEPLSHVSVVLVGSDRGVKTDVDGKFTITTTSDFSHVHFSLLGYTPVDKSVRKGRNNKLKVWLTPEAITLEEVLVRPGKERYSKKNNPAVDLARRLIATRSEGDVENEYPYFTQRKYEKTTFAFDNFDAGMRANPVFRSIPFISSYADTSDVGIAMDTLYELENSSHSGMATQKLKSPYASGGMYIVNRGAEIASPEDIKTDDISFMINVPESRMTRALKTTLRSSRNIILLTSVSVIPIER